MTARLQSTRHKLEEVEEIRLTLVEEKSQREKVGSVRDTSVAANSVLSVSPLQALFQVSSHREEMEVTIQRLKAALDDQRQENTELISKVS